MHTMHPHETIGARPASALDLAIMQIEEAGRAQAERQRRIDTDPRIVRLRSMSPIAEYQDGDDGRAKTFADLVSGRSAKRARIASLVRARIGQIDNNHAAVRVNLRDAAATRRMV